MQELAGSVVPYATLVFATSSMLAAGLSTSASRIAGPVKNKLVVFLALIANFVLVPLLGFLVVRAFRLEFPLAIGLFLVSTAAGAPFLMKLVRVAHGSMSFAAALLVLLLPLTIVSLVGLVPLALPQAEVNAWAIAQPLLWSMLLPLAVGVLARPRMPALAARMLPTLHRISTLSLVVLVAGTLFANWDTLGEIGFKGLFCAALLILGAFSIGYTLGGRLPKNRRVLALGTAQRNISAAAVVSTQTFANLPATLSMVIATALVGFALLFPLAYMLRRRAIRRERAQLREQEV